MLNRDDVGAAQVCVVAANGRRHRHVRGVQLVVWGLPPGATTAAWSALYGRWFDVSLRLGVGSLVCCDTGQDG